MATTSFTTEQHLNWVKTGHIGEALLSYAVIKGVTPAMIKTELWEDTVDDHWKIVCNGTHNKIGAIPPYSWSIEFNGWPAGFVSVITGESFLCAGVVANAATLQQALVKSITSYLKITNP